MNNDNQQIVTQFFDLFSNFDSSRALSFLSPNAEFLVPGQMEPSRGAEKVVDGLKMWHDTFPDLRYDVSRFVVSEDGNTVVAEYVGRGTHQGELQMHEIGKLPPTNRRIEIPACDIFTFENGKIVSWTSYWQSELMLKQLGVAQDKAVAA